MLGAIARLCHVVVYHCGDINYNLKILAYTSMVDFLGIVHHK
jgi:hypothetical protein